MIKSKSFQFKDLTFFDGENSQSNYWLSQPGDVDFYDIDKIDFFSGDVCIDIGSHIGTLGLPLCKSNPDTTFIGFEANLNNYKNLLKAISFNQISNYIPNFCGVYGSSGKILESKYREDNTGANSIFNENSNEKSTYFSTISLDDIIKIHDIKKLKLFKIDCEGAEYEILYNSKKLKDIEIEYMYIEAHYYPKLDQSPERLIEYIEKELKVKNLKSCIINCRSWAKN